MDRYGMVDYRILELVKIDHSYARILNKPEAVKKPKISDKINVFDYLKPIFTNNDTSSNNSTFLDSFVDKDTVNAIESESELRFEEFIESFQKIDGLHSKKLIYQKIWKIICSVQLPRLSLAKFDNERMQIVLESASKSFIKLLDSVDDDNLLNDIHSDFLNNMSKDYCTIYMKIVYKAQSYDDLRTFFNENNLIKHPRIVDFGLESTCKKAFWYPTQIASFSFKQIQKCTVINIMPIPWKYSDSSDDISNLKTSFDDNHYFNKHFIHSRMDLIIKCLENLGRVYNICQPNIPNASEDILVKETLKIVFHRLQQSLLRHPQSPVILIGWLSGASLLEKILLTKTFQISCAVFINLPTSFLTESDIKNLQYDYSNINCPVLFICSKNSFSSEAKIEMIRSDMKKVDTRIIVVDYADNLLLVSDWNKWKIGLCQANIDSFIFTSVITFIHETCLLKLKKDSSTLLLSNSNNKIKRKLSTITSNSVD